MRVEDSLLSDIQRTVSLALQEDVGSGDLTAQLIPPDALIDATVVARESMTMAGRPWVDEVCRQVDDRISLDWQQEDGATVSAESIICTLHGPARSILTAERTALNFLQMLSATATVTADYVRAVAGTNCRILDTRKTIPGLRQAQKYAVRCGGGENHRIGLFDAILIKENHIKSAGSIKAAINAARNLHANMPIEIEVESLDELRETLSAKAERILLDNFSLDTLEQAVAINRSAGEQAAKLEASGGLTIGEIAAVAATGVDYISVGALTKNIRAIDLSMLFEPVSQSAR
jgi:nicotinate-nucleotide pyrophosphorylase (carboxylating)